MVKKDLFEGNQRYGDDGVNFTLNFEPNAGEDCFFGVIGSLPVRGCSFKMSFQILTVEAPTMYTYCLP